MTRRKRCEYCRTIISEWLRDLASEVETGGRVSDTLEMSCTRDGRYTCNIEESLRPPALLAHQQRP